MNKSLEYFGFGHHPFEPLEASADRRLNQHSIKHPVLFDAWARDDCFIVGEPGSGRTTVVEQLLYDCRMGNDSSHKFPVRLNGAELTSIKSISDLANYSAAVEALLQLTYKPWMFEELKPKERSVLVAALESAAPGILNQFLPQIEKSGSLIPVAEFADLPALALPGKPKTGRVREMARQIGQLSRSESRADKALPSILDIVPGLLGFNEIKLVADFQAIPRPERLDELDACRARLRQTGGKATLVTLVPPGSNPGGRRYIDGFTIWSKEKLVNVLRNRIESAAGGGFDSLDAVSDPSIREIEDLIVKEAGKRGHATPRDVLSLAKRVLECRKVAGKNASININTFLEAVKKEYGDDP